MPSENGKPQEECKILLVRGPADGQWVSGEAIPLDEMNLPLLQIIVTDSFCFSAKDVTASIDGVTPFPMRHVYERARRTGVGFWTYNYKTTLEAKNGHRQGSTALGGQSNVHSGTDANGRPASASALDDA